MHIHIIYPEFSRFDLARNNQPFSGAPGDMFMHRTFHTHPEISYDVRIPNTPTFNLPYKPDSRILVLGQKSHKAIFGNNRDLNTDRGYCLSHQGHKTISTYDPMSMWEFKSSDIDEDEDDDRSDAKDVAPTKRPNYFAWALRDFNKLTLKEWPAPGRYHSTIHADPAVTAEWLDGRPPGSLLVLDIETRIEDHSLDCIGIADVKDKTANIVAVYNPDNQRAWPIVKLAKYWRALDRLFRRKDITIIGHNLAFDLTVLCAEYSLPIPPTLYDTMLAMHRQFPTTEKSLSHAISFYTFAARNHKGDIRPNTTFDNFNKLMSYNADDLTRTAEVYESQRQYQQADGGLAHAVAEANRLQTLTLAMSIGGMRVDAAALTAERNHLANRDRALTRICAALSGIADFNPASPVQVGGYFYRKLFYEIPEFTKSNAPSTSTKTLYKLHVKKPNPLIPLIIETKETRKALSMFAADLWRRMTVV